MTTSHRLRAVAVLGSLALLSACASDYHYSQLVGQRYFKTNIDTFPVAIVAVDGKGTTMKQTLVDPGRHEVTVQGPPGATGGFGNTQTVPLDIAPCTRYYLVATKSNRLMRDYSVKVDYQEPVPGCTPPA